MSARLAADHEGANGCMVVCTDSNAAGKCGEANVFAQDSPRCWIVKRTSDKTSSAEHQVEINTPDGRQQAAAEAAAAAKASAPVAATAAPWDKEVSTVLLQNLPRNVSQVVLAKVIALMGFANKIDFLYAPSEFGTKRGMGLAFVNFSSSADVENFAKVWSQEQPFSAGVKGGRLTRVLPACIQGYDANLATWEKTARQRIRNRVHRPLVANGAGMMIPYAGKAKH